MAAYIQTTPHRTVLQDELYARLYLRHAPSGQYFNQIGVVDGGAPNGFGRIAVNDWEMYGRLGHGASVVARAQGQHVNSSMYRGPWHNNFTIVFQDTDEETNGSTLQVMGTGVENGVWAIVGGTGRFTMAQGVIYKTFKEKNDNEDFIELDIHALYTPMKRSKASGPADGNAWTLGV